ncbi:oxygen-independent coproporphyrinogen-3 oxidase [Caldanaerobacter subterraneus subsp. tengcongensis MB4]|uniref:Heme chaperone HemW n=1 Tax=Caldanaerobacter subterraneus subsp. tengcongensis (strain DSM 15242 / JCM 11007 / NBRC 100824 / MB4) TaxID=273068 RepID=Q8RB71_CALS4|nr:radical SAM family heme chaperone HemW [Caldanaerobacter subterraneus]AAM24208.1 Coproporphyrinogen III oxidase and related FeS oxidoreductases [Caldanaerobacter subterraneus subsp. tengcongensis MB4]MCS3916264.1 oxygen-independent coproporphyrinogen-3 oxidase [Caldanaerobacter subterraneus subsp. tengcongensis MB4]
MREIGIYIHIPFCKKKCYYCDFNSYAGYEHLMEDYLKALLEEVKTYSDRSFRVISVYIGGGTPNFLPPSHVERVLSEVHKDYNVSRDAEITIEVNPGLLTEDKLKIYKINGINRISMGLQAFQNRLLEYIGRIHTAEDFLENYALVRKYFDNVNVDLIYALPTQSFEEWQETLTKVVELKPEHISTYSLILEENTLFGRLYKENRLPVVGEEEELKMYHWGIEFLKSKGYCHYEISNFALLGYQCRHNILYWECREYLGFGAGAHSYFEGTRWNNVERIEKYIEAILKRKDAREEIINLSFEDKMSEFMFLGLRMRKGVCEEEFRKRFGISMFERYEEIFIKYEKMGLIEKDKDCVRLTEKGIDVSNVIFEDFLP